MDSAAREPAAWNASTEVAKLLEANRASLWGRIYQSQGAFLHAGGDDDGAYRILSFAKALDESTGAMKALLPQGADSGNATRDASADTGMTPAGGLPSWLGLQPQDGQDYTLLMTAAALALVASAILMFLLLLVLILGCGNNSQGTRTAVRAKQKKGRA
jgi:hypothetical protein